MRTLTFIGILFCGLFVSIHGQAQVTVTTTPGTLAFTYQQGAALPKAQTFSVKPSTGKPTFTTSTPPTDFWLTVNINAGTLPATIGVQVNPSSLPVGAYTSAVTITVAGVVAPAVVNITLQVNAAPSSLSLSANSLSFTAPPNPAPAQTVTLSTNGSPISFTATAGAAWLTVSPTIGIVLPGEVITLSIDADATNLTPSAIPYTANVTVVASGASVTVKSQNIAVSVVVNSTTPTIASVWPPILPQGVTAAQTITIRGTNFYASSLAEVPGIATPLATTLISPTALLAVVPASLLTGTGVLNVVVVNPPPGGASAPDGVPVQNVPTIFGVFNAASYGTATVSPGELITMFGANIGPPIPATMNVVAGYVSSNLGGVTVTIAGQPAPILYVSSDQITVQVPYEAGLGPAQAVVVTNGTNPPANTTVTIAAQAPGIFTADGSGVGQAAAINTGATSGLVTLNSSTTPAKIGDTISLYLTGEGNYNPAPISGATNTGFIIPPALSPLPQMAPLPTVKIGGVDASVGVSYAGVVPGSIIGLLQINVVVPVGSATGASVPVIVTIGGVQTQANVTINVHP